MLALLTATALGSTVTLHVGVHREAGTPREVAADGAAGQCTVGAAWLVCPATGPVTFRYGPGRAWVLEGDTTLTPGETGRAWVLAAAPLEVVSSAEGIRGAFLRDGRTEPPPPDRTALELLEGQTASDDPAVRAAAVEALIPWYRRTASDPLPPEAPTPFSPGLLDALAQDESHAVRLRVVWLVRDLEAEDRADEAARVLARLVDDRHRRVRRAALAALSGAAADGTIGAEEAWERALAAVPEPDARGRAASNTLARLAAVVEPSDRVDPERALDVVLRHHPERAWRYWSAWKEHLPFRRDAVDRLLHDTLGASPGLLRHWAREVPTELAAALAAWEPVAPHSERWETIRGFLLKAEDPHLREVLELP